MSQESWFYRLVPPTQPQELVELGVRLARSPAATRHLHLIYGPLGDETAAGHRQALRFSAGHCLLF